MTRLCSISVDLDPISCYARIHGLGTAPGEAAALQAERDPIYATALPRLLDLFAEFGVRATFFTVGEEAQRAPEVIRQAASAGHEIANHSFTHPYTFGALARDELARELAQAQTALGAITGRAPLGFRAPGYNISAMALAELEAQGLRYDASVFPCLPYYLAKSAVMAWQRLRGRRSGSAAVDPRTLLAPLDPYRPDRRQVHRVGVGADASTLVEIPICVLPLVRWPIIGTSLLLLGEHAAVASLRAAMHAHPRFLNLELHGIDVAAPDDSGIDPRLTAKQPDLRLRLDTKLALFRRCFAALRQRCEFVTMAEMAEIAQDTV